MAIKSDKSEKKTGRVSTYDGKFVGIESWNGAAVFHGIVYARYGRFGMPEIVCYDGGHGGDDGAQSGVSGAYDATSYGCLCPQNLSHLLGQLGPDSGIRVGEGELCLSVTVPPGVLRGEVSGVRNASFPDCGNPSLEREKLPVMVWIHGGSYLTGGSEDHRYDVSGLAAEGNVAVVKISYRLGAEGYLWMPEAGVANLGLEDQKTALEWIRRHISSFGGDPGNVTVFGQSAGAHSIASLIASADDVEPCTHVPRFGGRTLFRKAILQSPPLGIRISKEEASDVTAKFLDRLAEIAGGRFASACPPGRRRKICMDACRDGSISLEQIIMAQDDVRHLRRGMTFMPVLPDNMRVPAPGTGFTEDETSGCGTEELRFRAVLGYNAEDASPYARKALGPLWHTPLDKFLTKALTDRIFRKPVLRYGRRLSEAGIPVSVYRFGWHPEGSELGACHSIELPFLLGRPEDWKSAEMLSSITPDEFEHYGALLRKLWTGFARDGKLSELPGGPEEADRLYSASSGFMVW